MADDMSKESISALMDGEMADHEMERLLPALRSDQESREVWERYHLIGDALRKNLPGHIDGSFASRVSQAIAAEPEILPSSVVQFKPKPKPAEPARRAISRPLAGFAIAATVAMVTFVGVGMISVDEHGAALPMAGNAPQTMVAMQPAPMEGVQTVQGQRWNVATPAVESKLNTYLSDHHSISSMAAMNNRMLPNVRLVETQPFQGE